MNLKQIWNNQKAKFEAVDEFAVMFIDKQAELQEKRLVNYMKIAGLILILSFIITALKGFWIPSLIIACTLHIHIIVNYRFKKLSGVPQWKKMQTPEQPPSETG